MLQFASATPLLGVQPLLGGDGSLQVASKRWTSVYWGCSLFKIFIITFTMHNDYSTYRSWYTYITYLNAFFFHFPLPPLGPLLFCQISVSNFLWLIFSFDLYLYFEFRGPWHPSSFCYSLTCGHEVSPLAPPHLATMMHASPQAQSNRANQLGTKTPKLWAKIVGSPSKVILSPSKVIISGICYRDTKLPFNTVHFFLGKMAIRSWRGKWRGITAIGNIPFSN